MLPTRPEARLFVALTEVFAVAIEMSWTNHGVKQLFGVTPTDPLTFGVVLLILGTAALAATVIAARRATGVDPMVALRQE